MRPLILLDVDGVVNDLGAARGVSRRWVCDVVRSHGYDLYVPDFMPSLIGHLARVAEVWWCTTWRHRANDELAAHLGVGPFPVVDDGSDDGTAEVARRIAGDAPSVPTACLPARAFPPIQGPRDETWPEATRDADS